MAPGLHKLLRINPVGLETGLLLLIDPYHGGFDRYKLFFGFLLFFRIRCLCDNLRLFFRCCSRNRRRRRC